MTSSSLIDVNDSVLIVIDVQHTFLQKLPTSESEALLHHIRWLIGLADWLNVPIVTTAEDIDTLGGPHPDVLDALGSDAIVHNKTVFGLADAPEIFCAVEQTGRKTAVLVGLETDVCVAQSALGLMDRGYRVVTVTDATHSPGDGHQIGLDRIRAAGGIILSVKSLYYEWVRTVERDDKFQAQCPQLEKWFENELS